MVSSSDQRACSLPRTIAVALLGLVAACANETVEHAQPARLAQPDRPAPEQARDAQPPTQPPTPAPTPKQIAPTHSPELRVLEWGECADPAVDVVGEQVFARHMVRSKKNADGYDAVIRRMGRDGSVVQELRFDVTPMVRLSKTQNFRPAPQHVRKLGGRWPDGLFALVHYSHRNYEATRIARWSGEAWDVSNLLGHSAQWSAIWPWHDGTTLGLLRKLNNGRNRLRMAVVEGPGKGPLLTAVKRKKGCNTENLEFADIHVSEAGPVWGLVACESTWMVGWTPEDREGVIVLLSDHATSGELDLDEKGNGFIGLDGGEAGGLYRWRDGTATRMESPGDAPHNLTRDANGAVWLVEEHTVYRQHAGGWQSEISGATQLGGVGGSSPIVELLGGDLRARTSDGTWHVVDLPQPDPKGSRPDPVDIVVPESGDVWVTAKYRRQSKGKNVQRKFGVIYTQRSVGTSMKCK